MHEPASLLGRCSQNIAQPLTFATHPTFSISENRAENWFDVFPTGLAAQAIKLPTINNSRFFHLLKMLAPSLSLKNSLSREERRGELLEHFRCRL